jgi:hypothetical protein
MRFHAVRDGVQFRRRSSSPFLQLRLCGPRIIRLPHLRNCDGEIARTIAGLQSLRSNSVARLLSQAGISCLQFCEAHEQSHGCSIDPNVYRQVAGWITVSFQRNAGCLGMLFVGCRQRDMLRAESNNEWAILRPKKTLDGVDG